MQFKEMIGVSLSTDEKIVMENAKAHILAQYNLSFGFHCLTIDI